MYSIGIKKELEEFTTIKMMKSGDIGILYDSGDIILKKNDGIAINLSSNSAHHKTIENNSVKLLKKGESVTLTVV